MAAKKGFVIDRLAAHQIDHKRLLSCCGQPLSEHDIAAELFQYLVASLAANPLFIQRVNFPRLGCVAVKKIGDRTEACLLALKGTVGRSKLRLNESDSLPWNSQHHVWFGFD